jgi:hypothetical protein
MEFVGRARALRRQIAAAHPDYDAACEALLAPLRPRPGFSPMPRHKRLRSLARSWRALRSPGRLRCVAGFDRDTGLRIIEVLAVPVSISFPDWNEDEPSLAVVIRHVAIRPPDFTDKMTICAVVGLHALARRAERGQSRGERAMLADLLPLGRAFVAAMRVGDVEVEVAASGGSWRGQLMTIADRPALAVRTFVA